MWIPQRGLAADLNSNEPNNAIMGNDIAHHDTARVFGLRFLRIGRLWYVLEGPLLLAIILPPRTGEKCI